MATEEKDEEFKTLKSLMDQHAYEVAHQYIDFIKGKAVKEKEKEETEPVGVLQESHESLR